MANCFYCNEPKHILLDRRLKETIPRNAVYDKEPCDKCRKYMEQGIILISVKDGETDKDNPYRTGGWWVVKKKFIMRIVKDGTFLDEILKKRVAFLEDKTCELIGLKKNETKITN